jgi:alkanesulfonate monooxygenase SsuD/methylene tetrahydromethanopterin reductase-like flavin-dependent oxidoreductase (luciferase family)
MKRNLTGTLIGVMLTIAFAPALAGQSDWYRDREARFGRDREGTQIFLQVKQDLDHIWSANRAADNERQRLERTRQELMDLQAKLNRGQWDNGTVNDVIDSLRKSANDDRLSSRDRQVLADDANRIHSFQAAHNGRR